MVHPSELLRTNSNEGRTFSAPTGGQNDYQLDCGLSNLPVLNRCCNLERLAKPNVFLVILSVVGFLQGVTLTYFRETARIWRTHYHISQENIDWLIYTNEFFIGFFALFVSYYGNRIHRMSWIGALTIFQSIASVTLVVPEEYRKDYEKTVNISQPYLCNIGSSKPTEDSGELNYVALAILIVFQIFYAMASISFISHGISYIDDNTSRKTSSVYIGIVLAISELGKQAGLYFSWIPQYFKVNAVFVSPVWLTVVSLAFIFGTLIAMFPRNLPSVLVRTLSASIIDLASGYTTPRKKEIVDGFFKTFFRLLRCEILMVNIFSAVLIQSGLINFNIFEKYVKQARFQVSDLNDSSLIQLTTNILKQPLVAISLIATGFLAAKTKPHLKSLVKWNIAAIILAIAIFASTAFLRCEPNTKYDKMLAENKCNRDCHCKIGEFEPICVNSKTYYSPCFAGCQEVIQENSRTVFTKCGCSRTDKGAQGPCNVEKCDLYYTLSQVNNVFTTSLLASTFVTNLIINMRCILSRDKAAALGLEAALISLIAYLPVRAVYGAAAENYCVLPKNLEGVCRLYSKNFATFLSACTIGFMGAGLILAVVVLILLKLKPIKESYDDEDDDDNVELREVEQPLRSTVDRDETDLVESRVKSDSANSFSSSLLEMENVGDDHDSVDSSSFLDERPQGNTSRVIESDL